MSAFQLFCAYCAKFQPTQKYSYMANFLHGAEVIEVQAGVRPINTVRSGVIGLVGTAPIGPNAITLITSPRQAAETFGEQVPGFTIPQALDAIFAQGGARVLVINTFVAADHTATVADEAVTVAAGGFTLDHAPVGAIVLTDSGGTTTYVAGTHYTVDAFGVVRIIDTTTIPNGTALLADYSHLDPTGITATVINGSAALPRTGFELFDEAETLFGYAPKILIAPTYNEVAAVATKMRAKAAAYRGVAIFDAPSSATVATAIAGRGAGGTIPTFQVDDKRAILTFPYVSTSDSRGNAATRPMSAYYAGVMANVDNTEGYWVSPSNHTVKGILGPAKTVTSGINAPDSDANLLNEAGIVTLFNAFGAGFRLWGNSNAGRPSSTDGDIFVSVQRTKDVLNDSVERAMLPYIDRPINAALIDAITESVNAFIRSLIARGALADGECVYNPADNPPLDVAAGKLVFAITFACPTPAERITFNSYLDQSLLAATLVQ